MAVKMAVRSISRLKKVVANAEEKVAAVAEDLSPYVAGKGFLVASPSRNDDSP
jgi:hypothetical protein